MHIGNIGYMTIFNLKLRKKAIFRVINVHTENPVIVHVRKKQIYYILASE